MLLLDEDQLSDRDLPSAGDANGPNSRNAKKKEQLLSEIAEEDDVSSISETMKNPYGTAGQPANGARIGGLGSGGKRSSVASVQSTSKLSATHE